MSQKDKGKQSNKYPRVLVYPTIYPNKIKCLKMDKSQTEKKKKKKNLT
jgi:hypothetical protein